MKAYTVMEARATLRKSVQVAAEQTVKSIVSNAVMRFSRESLDDATPLPSTGPTTGALAADLSEQLPPDVHDAAPCEPTFHPSVTPVIRIDAAAPEISMAPSTAVALPLPLT